MLNSSQLSFLKNLIDYAGIFPPASLSLEQAIHLFAAYLSGEDAWMLGRFILPASRLPELEPYLFLFSPQRQLECAVLGRRSDSNESCMEGLKADLEEVRAFREQYGEIVKIDVLELALPPYPMDRELLLKMESEVHPMGLELFCELATPFHADWQRALLQTLDEMASQPAFGLKLRTGGITADAFPTPEQVATVLHACRERKLALKFTAGLHHPIRMYRKEIGSQMHGFLNVFAAGMLAYVNNLDVLEIEKILADEEPDHFSFQEEGLIWKDKVIPVPEITTLRAEFLRSFGSCSFAEPREDLRMLKLL